MKKPSCPIQRLAITFAAIMVALPGITCAGGSGGGGKGGGEGPGDPGIFEGTCVESLARCFDAEGDLGCEGNFVSGSVSFVFDSGARLNVSYSITPVAPFITDIRTTAVNSLDQSCFSAVENSSGDGALVTDARNGNRYVVLGNEVSDTVVELTFSGPGCGPDTVTLDKNDPQNPVPELDFTQCLDSPARLTAG